VRGSGVAGTPSALFGFEQTVGIHFSLERRHEGRPGSPCRLARVVGRVESVCTDPAAKGPTGPLCFVHLRMRSSFRCLPGSSPSLVSRSAACLAAPGAELRRRSENALTLLPHPALAQGIVYNIV
jgi:hypothetical protein